jgi:hypothetical protein
MAINEPIEQSLVWSRNLDVHWSPICHPCIDSSISISLCDAHLKLGTRPARCWAMQRSLAKIVVRVSKRVTTLNSGGRFFFLESTCACQSQRRSASIMLIVIHCKNSGPTRVFLPAPPSGKEARTTIPPSRCLLSGTLKHSPKVPEAVVCHVCRY